MQTPRVDCRPPRRCPAAPARRSTSIALVPLAVAAILVAGHAHAQAILFANGDSRSGFLSAFASGAGPSVEDGYEVAAGAEFQPVKYSSTISAGTGEPNSVIVTLNTTSEWVGFDSITAEFTKFTLAVDGSVSQFSGSPGNSLTTNSSVMHWTTIDFTIAGLPPGATIAMRLHGDSAGMASVHLLGKGGSLYSLVTAAPSVFDETFDLPSDSYTLMASSGNGQQISVGSWAGSATMNLTLEPVAVDDCIGDLTGSGSVGGADLGILLASWGPCPGCPADLNGDGVVDGLDLGLLLGSWGDDCGGKAK